MTNCSARFASPLRETHDKASVIFGINYVFTTRACREDGERKCESLSWFKIACHCSLVGNENGKKISLCFLYMRKAKIPFEMPAYIPIIDKCKERKKKDANLDVHFGDGHLCG